MSSNLRINLPSSHEVTQFEKELLEAGSEDEIEFSFLKFDISDRDDKDSLRTELGDIFVIDTKPKAASEANEHELLFAIDTTKSKVSDGPESADDALPSGFSSTKELM